MADTPIRFTRTYRRLVRGTNINERSLLATDYLNHFNEVVMMLEMVADMPEMIEDVREWRPRSYPDHFRQSVFTDRELAVYAYENAPREVVETFEAVVREVDAIILEAVERISAALAERGPDAADAPVDDALRCYIADTTARIRGLLEKAGAVINGTTVCNTQDEIDRLIMA